MRIIILAIVALLLLPLASQATERAYTARLIGGDKTFEITESTDKKGMMSLTITRSFDDDVRKALHIELIPPTEGYLIVGPATKPINIDVTIGECKIIIFRASGIMQSPEEQKKAENKDKIFYSATAYRWDGERKFVPYWTFIDYQLRSPGEFEAVAKDMKAARDVFQKKRDIAQRFISDVRSARGKNTPELQAKAWTVVEHELDTVSGTTIDDYKLELGEKITLAPDLDQWMMESSLNSEADITFWFNTRKGPVTIVVTEVGCYAFAGHYSDFEGDQRPAEKK